MSQNNHSESGMTLVELLIGAALLGLVLIIGSSFIARVQKSAKHDENRGTARRLIESLLHVIQRDAAVQITGGLTLPGNASELNIARLPQGANDESQSYQVLYQSKCQPFPSTEQVLLERIYSSENRGKIYKAPNNCLKALNCPDGSYPVVSLVLTGNNSAPYPQTKFPGTALCATQVNDQIQVVLESVYTAVDRDTLPASVQQKVFMLPIKDSSDLTILPN